MLLLNLFLLGYQKLTDHEKAVMDYFVLIDILLHDIDQENEILVLALQELENTKFVSQSGL